MAAYKMYAGAVGICGVVVAVALVSVVLHGTPDAQAKKLPAVMTARQQRAAELVLIPGGRVQIGDNTAPPDERPAFNYQSKPLLMDRTPVTVRQFRSFVTETRYVTDAKRLRSGGVLDKTSGGWATVRGADWQRPHGPSGPRAIDTHPVTQVSWNDAQTFCKAYGARLPTEEEWERAARLGQTPDGHVFKAGDPIHRGDHFYANVWQGLFPLEDTGADGYTTTSPVGAFGAAPSGLTDMAGNVWEWTTSWYAPYGQPNGAPAGGGGERVQRGGSFLCDPTFCQGFRATARGHSTPDTALEHIGFRCVVDPGSFLPLAGRVVSVGRSAVRKA